MNDQQLDNLLRKIAPPMDWEARLKSIVAQQAESAAAAYSDSILNSDSDSILDSNPAFENEVVQTETIEFDPGEVEQGQTAPTLGDKRIGEPNQKSVGRDPWRTTAWLLGLAASILVLVFCGSAWWLAERNIDGQLAIKQAPLNLDSPADNFDQMADADQFQLAELDRQAQVLRSKLAILETRQLKQQLQQTESLRRRERVHLPAKATIPSDLIGLSMVATAESILIAGYPAEFVKQDLHFVVQQYPRSNEAIRAAEILSQFD